MKTSQSNAAAAPVSASFVGSNERVIFIHFEGCRWTLKRDSAPVGSQEHPAQVNRFEAPALLASVPITLRGAVMFTSGLRAPLQSCGLTLALFLAACGGGSSSSSNTAPTSNCAECGTTFVAITDA